MISASMFIFPPRNSIRHFRLSKDMTQEDLALAAGCRRETIGNLETGRYNPSWQLVYRIAQALEVCPCVLMLDKTSWICESPDYYLIE